MFLEYLYIWFNHSSMKNKLGDIQIGFEIIHVVLLVLVNLFDIFVLFSRKN